MNTFTAHSMEQAWATLGLSVIDAFGTGTMWSSLTFWPGWAGDAKGGDWTARLEIPKPRTGRRQMYWRFYADGETPAKAMFALAGQVRERIVR